MRIRSTALADSTLALLAGAGTAVAQPTLSTGSAPARTASSAPASTSSGTTKADAAYLTLLFGRTQWVSADKLCKQLPNTVTLGRVASVMKDRGKAGVGNVVVKRHGVTQSCFSNYVISPSWNDLTQLRTQFGWTFTSAGMTYANMTTLTPTQQHAEACGSVGALARRGHTRSWGLFAYPNNKYTDKIQSQVVKKCFAFGRVYGDTATSKTVATKWPNWQTTVSVNGGKCADTTQSCSTLPYGPTYMTPAQLIPKVRVNPGNWSTVQFYRFVTGTSAPGTVMQWNCSGPENTHWTSDAEIYCMRDFVRVLDAIPSTVTVTDPATVAAAWGVKPSA